MAAPWPSGLEIDETVDAALLSPGKRKLPRDKYTSIDAMRHPPFQQHGPKFPPNNIQFPHGPFSSFPHMPPHFLPHHLHPMAAMGPNHHNPPPPRAHLPPQSHPRFSRASQNDYCQHFVDTGQRPQNFIRDMDMEERFEEYPKLRELIQRKDKLARDRATPPMYLRANLKEMELNPSVFGTKFDVILLDPPWEEYARRAPGSASDWWAWEDIMALKIEAIADNPCFLFMWVGDAEGLDKGRLCLRKWGFRRCEDICWVKTNRDSPGNNTQHDSDTILQHSKEHCLMGIKGTVRRSSDGHIIHANIDTDIIISEEPPYGSTRKPEELYHIIEHFALGRRRLELFGEDHNMRAGWVTVGKDVSTSNFNPEVYANYFLGSDGKAWQGRGNPPFDAPHLLGTTSEIEALRPKSPVRTGQGSHPVAALPTRNSVVT